MLSFLHTLNAKPNEQHQLPLQMLWQSQKHKQEDGCVC